MPFRMHLFSCANVEAVVQIPKVVNREEMVFRNVEKIVGVWTCRTCSVEVPNVIVHKIAIQFLQDRRSIVYVICGYW